MASDGSKAGTRHIAGDSGPPHGGSALEEALNPRDDFYRILFEENPIETIVVDRHGSITGYNRAKRRSGKRVPALGEVMYRDYAGKHRLDMHGELIACMATGTPREFPVLAYEDRYLFVRMSPFSEGAIITSIDITEQITAERELREAHELLKDQAEFMKRIMDSMSEGLFVLDDRARCILANRACTAMLGGKQEEFVEELMNHEVLTAAFGVESLSGFAKQMEEKRKRTKRTSFHHNGIQQVLVFRSTPLQWMGKDHLLCLVEEGTERYENERALMESRRRYKSLFEHTPVSVMELDFSHARDAIETLKTSAGGNVRKYLRNHPEVVKECWAELTVLNTNRATTRLFRAKRKKDLAAYSVADFVPDRSPFLVDAIAALAEGRGRFKAEAELRSLDQARILADLYVSVSPGGSRDTSKLLVSAIDVTEQQAAAQALKESEAKYRRLVENISNLVFSFDNEGVVTYVNPAFEAATGYTASELVGRNIRILKFRGSEPVKKAWSVLSAGLSYSDEYRFKTRSGAVRWFETILTPVAGESGVIEYLGVLVDVTEHREMQQYLMRSERLAATGQLAASIAHEINSPLQAVTMILNTLSLKYGTDETLMGHVSLLKESYERIRGTVRNLLDLNRPSGRDPQAVDLNQVIQRTMDLMGSFLRGCRVDMELALSGRLPPVMGHPQQLSQLFMNLINNAVEAMSVEGPSEAGWIARTATVGTVRIQTRIQKGEVIVKVADTGPGVPAEELDFIFDAFYTTKKQKGTGVGLSICHAIVQEHRGRIDAVNAPEGGMVFTIRFPAMDAPGADA